MERLHLGYHFVRDGAAPGLTCSPKRLRAQVLSLHERGFAFLTCGEVARRMRDGLPLPERYATLSFDDGLRDQYTTAFPILRELGVPATFFIITCALDGEIPPVLGLQMLVAELGAERLEREILPEALAGTAYATLLDPTRYDIRDAKQAEAPEVRRIYWVVAHFLGPGKMRDLIADLFARYVGGHRADELRRAWCMSRDELIEMDRAGMEIASHTVTHPLLPNCGRREIEWEAAESRRQLQDLLGHLVPTFAWTYGGQFSEGLQYLLVRHFESAWNFFSKLTAMPPLPDRYRPSYLYDIPRLQEAVFDP